MKFEELKEGMFVWDTYYKDIVEILLYKGPKSKKMVRFYRHGFVAPYEETFEPNRFYRKEVEE